MGAEIRERPENTEDLATLRNLEIGVRGHSMSLTLVPFEIFIPHLYLSPSQGVTPLEFCESV